MAGLSPLPRMIFWDALGNPVPEGSKLYTYAAGTTTPKATYTNQGAGTPNDNPLDLDGAQGNNIWFLGAYKVDVKDAEDVSLPGYPIDNVIVYDLVDWSGLTATIAMLNATDTSTVSTAIDYTVISSNRGKTILCNATSAAITVALLSAASATNGYEITIKKTDVTTNLVTIDANVSETIEGRLTFILYDQNDVVTLLCDGSNWRVKSGVIRGNTQLKSDAFTTVIDDIGKTFICSASAAYSVTLLSAVTAGDGFKQTFKKSTDTFNITIDPAGAETIDGQATYILNSPYQFISIISDGTNWLINGGDSISQQSQTGDIFLSMSVAARTGWVILNDGTIGSATSGGTTRANADTRDLFELLWNNVSDANCPVSSGRGASASADFAANKTIAIPRALGRVFGQYGAGSGLTSRDLAYFFGEENHALTLAENGPHTHTVSNGTTGGLEFSPSGVGTTSSAVVTTSSSGSGTAHNTMQPTIFVNAYIKL